MDFFSIIIDRVDMTNVFNILQGRLPSRDTHLQTIVDDDLINEFLNEIERLSRISNSAHEQEASLLPLDISAELKRIGETFFLQFFPEQIQEKLKRAEDGFLFMHTCHLLRNIPWELFHDGNCFLADKFYMGKNISGYWRDADRPERERLRVLIIADPTEDLKWAQLEGEGLFESLNAELSADRLDVQFLSGKRITKLNLLNAIKDRDIIHYSGHLYYSPNQQESGWLLSDGKVLRAREIEKAGLSPNLVFSNSCLSSPISASPEEEDAIYQGNRFSSLAGAFLKAGIGNYIGTNWEIKDNSNTYDFAMHFYRAIFEEKSVGEALFEARSHARKNYDKNDMTWANYVLYGNPLTRIYRSAGRPTFDASRNQLSAVRVIDFFPMPIASSYKEFLDASADDKSSIECLKLLITTFKKTMFVVGAIVFGNFKYLHLKGELPGVDAKVSFLEWIDAIYNCIHNIRSLDQELAIPGLLEALYLHKEQVEKLIKWSDQFTSGEFNEESTEIHLVTFQYLFDNFLSDLSPVGKSQLVSIINDGNEMIFFQGLQSEIRVMDAPEFQTSEFLEFTERNENSICLYNKIKKLIFPVEEFIRFEPSTGAILFPAVTDQGLIS